MNKIILCLTVHLIMYNIGKAQDAAPAMKLKLEVGDIVPQLPLFGILNYPKSQIDINESHEKVLILDFFDTYCSNCILSMPKLNQLQSKLGASMEIVMVGWQNKETLEKFYDTNKFLKERNVSLSTIHSDTLLKQYFPHKGIPHVVWVYKGRVAAITHSDFVTEDRVKELIREGQIDLPRKDDFRLAESLERDSTFRFLGNIEITGYNDKKGEYDGVHIVVDSIGKGIRTSFSNVGVLSAYKALMAKIEKPQFLLTPQRLVWKVSDSNRYEYIEGTGGQHAWLANNAICYERFDRIKRSEEDQAKVVIKDLESFLSLRFFWEQLEQQCLVIKKTKPMNTKGKLLEGQSIGGTGVLAFLLDYEGTHPPVIDEALSKETIILGEYTNINELNGLLLPYGLKVITAKRKTKVLCVEEVN